MSDGLEVRDLTVRYGGSVAVENASFDAPLGRVTGLIGPNGAGKTTTFNAVEGIVPMASGTVRLFGNDVTRSSTPARARLGMGRTFQRIELVGSMSVRTNVALGREARLAGRSALRQVLATPGQRRDIAAAVDEAIDLCGLGALADELCASLSTGKRRLVELARVLAGRHDLLLLDEPSSGLDERETAAFGALLHKVLAERGCGILLVEHDMSLVMDVCAHIHVLDFGHMLFEGSPAEVQSSPVVRKAYLGGADEDAA